LTVLALLKQKENVARSVAAEARNSAENPFDAESFEIQAQAAADARDTIAGILEEKGPIMFPSELKRNPEEHTSRVD
jgi:hypothetical protein